MTSETIEVLTVELSMDIASKVIGLVFLYAAVSKILSFRHLVGSIGYYKIPSGIVAPIAAALLIVGESLISLSHLTGFGLRYVAIGTLAPLSIFLIIATTLVQSGDVRAPCLCFGFKREDYIGRITVVRIAILLVTEVALCLGFQIRQAGQILIEGETPAILFQEFLIATLIAVLFGSTFSFLKLYRAWVIART